MRITISGDLEDDEDWNNKDKEPTVGKRISIKYLDKSGSTVFSSGHMDKDKKWYDESTGLEIAGDLKWRHIKTRK